MESDTFEVNVEALVLNRLFVSVKLSQVAIVFVRVPGYDG